jgi:hypothetical protein
MTRVTSALVLAVLLGTLGVRLGCAWSCQPSSVTAAGHCHETSAAAFEFSGSAACNDVRSGSPLLVAAFRPDAATFATVDRVTSFSLAADDGVRLRPGAARQSHAASPPAFVIPLRQ